MPKADRNSLEASVASVAGLALGAAGGVTPRGPGSGGPPFEELVQRVRQLHRDRRTARLNRYYYQELLNRVQGRNRTLDILTAIAGSTTVGTWTIWLTKAGSMAWGIVGAVAALVGIVKPFFKLPDLIETYAALHGGFSAIEGEFSSMVDDVQASGTFLQPKINRLTELATTMYQLAAKDTRRVDEHLRQKYTDQVNRELPPESLWTPKAELKTQRHDPPPGET